MQETRDVLLGSGLALPLLAAVGAGLLIGIERGWRQRDEAEGARVAGVRTFALIGGIGGLVAIIGRLLSMSVAAVAAAGIVAGLLAAFLRGRPASGERDATTMVAAFGTFLLGLLAGAGQPALAASGAALATLLLATRRQSHKLVGALSAREIQAIAEYSVIAAVILPFLPDRQIGPYDAWNPFELWLIVVFVTGFSLAGYVANRAVGEKRGTLVTALIGGAYSSTAVTAALSARLRDGEPGPQATGIALASAVMYLRVVLLAAILAPSVVPSLALLLAPACLVGWAAAAVTWRFDSRTAATTRGAPGRPFRLLPALGFLVVVAAAALLVRWAQSEFGEAGAAWSLFLAGSFDVDTAIVTLAGLPRDAIGLRLAALALAGTVTVNMAFKIGVTVVTAGWAMGRRAAFALIASELALGITLLWAALALI